MSLTITDEDRMIDATYILQTGLFKSRTSLYAAEASGAIPPSIKIGGARRWRLKTWRAFFETLEGKAGHTDALA